MHALQHFFPFAFSALPIVLVRPPPRWDDDEPGTWSDDDPAQEDMAPLDDGVEEFSPLPGLD